MQQRKMFPFTMANVYHTWLQKVTPAVTHRPRGKNINKQLLNLPLMPQQSLVMFPFCRVSTCTNRRIKSIALHGTIQTLTWCSGGTEAIFVNHN